MKTTIRTLAALAALALAGAAAASAAPAWQGKITTENGIPLVANPKDAPAAQTVLGAAELWRFGGDDENDPVLGLISDVALDAAGNAYLLDSNLSQIHVLSPAGEPQRVIGREGDGPGEFRNARRLAVLPGGNIAIMEMMPGQIVVLQPDGTPSPSLQLQGFETGMRHFQSLAADRNGVVVGGVTTSLDAGGAVIRHALNRYDAGGALVATLLSEEETQQGGAIRLGARDNEFTRFWTLGPDGRVAVYGPKHDYRIDVFDPAGKPERVITRDYESLGRTDEDMDAERQRFEEIRGRMGNAAPLPIDPLERDIPQVVLRADGTTWVATSRGNRACPAGSVGWFDVLDAQGRQTGTLRIPADFDPDRDGYAVRGDLLFVLKEAQMTSTSSTSAGGGQMLMITLGGRGSEDEEGEARPFEVICYRLQAR